ncbi:hypothetical protein SLEP1_g47837 [Rubroshorea leprosula]|uniref:Phytocyanin domain-containing protein n=1 Tax=Rubroshorea leprosula TaxID=152421 RepID=A0AAV5LSU0_9ROSI|nr:hypothetical protein SLEP1_g47837 [Rubroshorea leprosula]
MLHNINYLMNLASPLNTRISLSILKILFNYGGGAHTVDEVNASDYNTCTVGNYISTDQSGATTIALKTAGTHYFICSVTGHCGSGMKLAVDVAAAASPSGTPSSPSSSGAVSSVVLVLRGKMAIYLLNHYLFFSSAGI